MGMRGTKEKEERIWENYTNRKRKQKRYNDKGHDKDEEIGIKKEREIEREIERERKPLISVPDSDS